MAKKIGKTISGQVKIIRGRWFTAMYEKRDEKEES